MKTIKISLLVLSLSLLIACGGEKKKINGIPVVDVTKSYPEKGIVLQDIAEVDYIPLETLDDVLIEENYKTFVISSDSILIGNYKEGSVFLFNGQGKVLQKFNHKGQSGREYQKIWGVYYDRLTQEIILLDSPTKKQLQVYDNAGNYKRTIAIPKKCSFMGDDLVQYDENSFLCYRKGGFSGFSFGNDIGKRDSVKKEIKPYFFMSKKDGKELGDLSISLAKKVETNIISKQGNGFAVIIAPLKPIFKDRNTVILSEVSKDTIFTYSKDKKLKPIVVRTPEILKMEEPVVFLQIEKMTQKYIWGKTIKKGTQKDLKFPKQQIVIDRVTNEVYHSKVTNTDAPDVELKADWISKNNKGLLLSADKLKEWLEEGKLKGKLKQIAENINEDDNPVWVRVKFKN